MAKHNEVVLLDARLTELAADVYPDLDEDELFERASVDTILREHELTHQELEDGVVDGGDDGGVDAVYIFLNGELVSDESALRTVDHPAIELEVVQAKKESGFGETALQKLIDHLPQLTALGAEDGDLRVEFNEKLVDRFGLFRQVYLLHATRMPKLRVRVSYVTKAAGLPNAKVRAKADRLKKCVETDFPNATVEVEFFGAPQLNVLARSRPNQTGSPEMSGV